MTLGTYNRHQANKKKQAALAAAFPQGIRCQKCLEYGHWSFECKGKRKILVRPSRTQTMQKILKANEKGQCSGNSCKIPKKKKRVNSDGSDSSNASSDSSSDSSDSSSYSDISSGSESDSDSDSDSSSGSDSGSCSE